MLLGGIQLFTLKTHLNSRSALNEGQHSFAHIPFLTLSNHFNLPVVVEKVMKNLIPQR